MSDIVKLAERFEYWAGQSLEALAKAKAKAKKKLDPKAKIRNRGTVCVPASNAKDKKDHFPINNAGQARNALARVHQYSSTPSWYAGSLSSLQEAVRRKVHSKYPSIQISKKKKSSLSNKLLNKYSQEAMPLNLSAPVNLNQQATPAKQTPTQRPQKDPRIIQVQTKLKELNLKGADGKPLMVDGILGKNTLFAIQSYKTEYNTPKASDQDAIRSILLTKPEDHAGRYSATNYLEQLSSKFTELHNILGQPTAEAPAVLATKATQLQQAISQMAASAGMSGGMTPEATQVLNQYDLSLVSLYKKVQSMLKSTTDHNSREALSNTSNSILNTYHTISQLMHATNSSHYNPLQ